MMKSTKLLSETRKQMKDNNDQPLIVDPKIIRFESLNAGTLYIMTFSVRNNTLQSQRIRISAPKSKYFALNYIPSGVVAPGLDVRAEIECQLPSNMLLDQYVFTDNIVASMGANTLDVPLYASRPAAKIIYNTLANFGYVGVGIVTKLLVNFKNSGVKPGKISFRVNDNAHSSMLDIHPMEFTLQQGENINVELTLECSDLGVWRDVIQVLMDNSCDINNLLDVTAHAVHQKLLLLNGSDGILLEQLDFGALYYGQSKSVNAFLVNSGPNPLSFSIGYSDEEDQINGIPHTDDKDTSSDINNIAIDKFMTILPSDGVVLPFSQIPVVLRFKPEMPPITKGFSKQLTMDTKDLKFGNRKAFIDVGDAGLRVGISMEGGVSLPNVVINNPMLRFGDCPVNERRDISVVVENRSSLPTKYEFKKIAHFKVNSPQGILEPRQRKTFIVSFIPSQLGNYKLVMPMYIADGLQKIDVNLLAECNEIKGKKVLIGGIDQLPEDFATKYQFVDPIKIASQRIEKKKTAELQQLNATSANTRKHSGATNGNTFFVNSSSNSNNVASDSHSTAGSDNRDDIYRMGSQSSYSDKSNTNLDKFHPYTIKKENNKIYDSFIKTSYNQRMEEVKQAKRYQSLLRGAVDRHDPSGVDMGMDRGLDEPQLKVPDAGEPLWLANRPGGTGSIRKLAVDENRLIQKKFSSTPATQAEMKDCASELSIDKLKMVTASHKVIDFGKVCVNSVIAKNFVVSNDLSHSVLVSIRELESEMRQSKPAAQVIPAGASAGFDLLLSSKTLGIYKKSFIWIVNDMHIFKVNVTANIVPIELVMNKNNILLEFPDDLIEPSMSKDVILTNPGNAVAEFLWGNAGAFVCQPEKGTINPGQSAIISIVWTPVYGKKNEEELGLHITGGIDQTLSVVGKIAEAKAAFEEKAISLDSLSIGSDKIHHAHIKNIGNTAAVFFMDAIDDKVGLLISPQRGIIQPGESCQIELIFTPRSSMSYDNVKVTASIRNGKPTSIKLSGQSVAPDVHIIEDSFHFGIVITGSQYSIPFTIANNSIIAANVMLDLSAFPDFTPNISLDRKDPSEPLPTIQDDSHGNSIAVYKPQDGSHDNNNSHHSHHHSKHKNDKKRKGMLYKVTIAANSTLHGSIVFAPTGSPKTYSSKFPMYLMGMQDISYNKEFTAESSPSRILLSSTIVNFKDRVVDPDPMARSPYFLEFSITNLDVRGLTYELKDAAEPSSNDMPIERLGVIDSRRSKRNDPVATPAPPTFFLSQVKGGIAGGMKAVIRVSFSPPDAGDFYKKVELYISEQPDANKPYMIIVVKGCGAFPRLSFDTTSVTLPTVPLGMTSRSMFTIYNSGYVSLDLKYRLSPTITVPLELIFPDGQEIGISKRDRVRVIVQVKSNAPASWVGKIEFYDNDNGKFYISVAGCTDCCILTTYNFIKAYSNVFGFVNLENQPTQYMSRNDITEVIAAEARRKELARKQRSLELSGKVAVKGKDTSNLMEETIDYKAGSMDDSDGIDLDNSENNLKISDFDIQEAIALTKWLNKFVCIRQFDVNNFPQCIIDTNGLVVFDCIEQMSGSKIPGIVDDTSNASRQTHSRSNVGNNGSKTNSNQQLVNALKLASKYKLMIDYLLRGGALVNHIDYLALLGMDDYLLAQENEFRKTEGNRFTQSSLDERIITWKDSWLLNCSNSWLDVLFQAVKIYILSRVNYKSYLQIPGVTHTMQLNDSSSNAGDKDDGKQKKTKKPIYPMHLAASNVYSQAESILLDWAHYHILRAIKLPDEGVHHAKDRLIVPPKRIGDFSQFNSLYEFIQAIHSHIPDTSKHGGMLCGYSVDRTNVQHNYDTFNNFLNTYKLEFEASLNDIAASSRTLLLTLMHLYLNLPSLIPKTKIEFRGMLGSPVVNSIELKNPSKKKVVYHVSIQGSNEFYIDTHEVTINPESRINFPITLKAKFAEPSSAIITFLGLRQGSVAGSTMIFQLESVITGRKPVETVKKSMSVLEYEELSVKLHNPSNRDAIFSIKMYTSHHPATIVDLLNPNYTIPAASRPKLAVKDESDGVTTTSNGKKSSKPIEDDSDLDEIIQKPCWIVEENVTIPALGSISINVNILPFMMGSYTCQIVLSDKSAGEFCYELLLDVLLPKTMETCDFHAEMSAKGDTNVRMAMRVSSKNVAFEKAVNSVLDKRLTNPQKKARFRTVVQCLYGVKPIDDVTGHAAFLINFESPYYSGPKVCNFVSDYINVPTGSNSSSTIGSSAVTGKIDAGRPSSTQTKFKKCLKTLIEPMTAEDLTSPHLQYNSVFFTLQPDKSGSYNTMLYVFSKDNKYDIRVIDIHAHITLPKQIIQIEFIGAARQALVQDIPINNESKHDWHLQASIKGSLFSGPKTLTIPKGCREVYPLTFLSRQMGQEIGALTLSNPETHDSFEYILVGIADEPLSEGKLKYKCNARMKQSFEINLKPSKPVNSGAVVPEATSQTKKKKGDDEATTSGTVPAFGSKSYTVETDLPYFIGSSDFTLSSTGKGVYPFSIFSPIGGTFTGTITFTDKASGSMIWYTMEVEITSPQAESHVNISSVVRKAVAVEITLENPTNQELLFNVYTDGDGVIGDNTYRLAPKDVNPSAYELIYSPLIEGNFTGRISFVNDIVGEFWYVLNLTATLAEPTVVDTIESMLGSSNKTKVRIENPLPETVSLSITISDNEHFSVTPDVVTLGPYTQSYFNLSFKPSTLNDVVYGTVELSHHNFGSIVYSVSGIGQLPGNMPPIVMSAALGEIGSHAVFFRNPFVHPLPVDIVLSEDHNDDDDGSESSKPGVFSLLLRKANDIVIPPKGAQQLSLSFKPSRLGQYTASIQVRATVNNRNLLWCFPIAAMAEAGSPIAFDKMVTPCKTSILRDVDIKLHGLYRSDIGNANVLLSDITQEVIFDEKENATASRAFRAQPVEIIELQDEDEIKANKTCFLVRYRLLFEPLREFISTVQIVIECKNLGRWRVTTELESTEPEPDDVIKLVAPVGGVDKVSFKLSNRFLGYSTYEAFFTSKSSASFNVSPSTGVLAPYGSDGSAFVVTFTPTVYCGKEIGQLVIRTDDTQWNYAVHGSYPVHHINKNDIKSKIDTGRGSILE